MTDNISLETEDESVSGDDVREKYPTYTHQHLCYSASFVYVIGPAGGPYKIGFSTQPFKRLKDLSRSSPARLFPYVISQSPAGVGEWVERKIHEALDAHRVHGEWFDCCLETIKATVAIENPLGKHAEFI